MILFQNNKYGSMLKFKAAWEFHFPENPKDNDYFEVLEDNTKYRAQSFTWTKDRESSQEYDYEGL